MPHEVIMPALGMAQDTGLLVNWLKQPGDAVKAGDALFEVETDKSTMEVEAPADGFLTDVSASAGEDVPVGQVIARISDSPEGAGTAAPAAASEAPAPAPAAKVAGKEVIMPALGMAQDTGLIVAWHKAPGDAVAAGDVLLEVETDKSTMEVEAGHDGFVAALYAEAGEDVPVGNVIAVISADKPDSPVQTSARDKTPAVAPRKPDPQPVQPAARPEHPAPKPAATPGRDMVDGRILASPKARRLAAEQGLDLTRLVAAGIAQPYHVADLETLRALPTASPSAGAAPCRITASVPRAGFAAFVDWLSDQARTPPGAVQAVFAAASLRAATGAKTLRVRVEAPLIGTVSDYADPDLAGLAQATPADGAPPSLILRDLTGSRITDLALGADEAPVLSIATDGEAFSISLEFVDGQLDRTQAIAVIDGFAGRLDEPLRHLL